MPTYLYGGVKYKAFVNGSAEMHQGQPGKIQKTIALLNVNNHDNGLINLLEALKVITASQ